MTNIIQAYEAEQVAKLSAARAVPAVLLSGNHAAIAAWRRSQAETITRARRPDLWAAHEHSKSGPIASAAITS